MLTKLKMRWYELSRQDFLNRETRSENSGAINSSVFAGYTSSSKMQMSQTIPSGANRCQQIPGKQILTRYTIQASHDCEMIEVLVARFNGKVLWKVSVDCAAKSVNRGQYMLKTLTFYIFIVLCITSSTLETRYIWKSSSVVDLLFCALSNLFHLPCLRSN